MRCAGAGQLEPLENCLISGRTPCRHTTKGVRPACHTLRPHRPIADIRTMFLSDRTTA